MDKLKKFLKPKHVTTLFALGLLGLSTGIISIDAQYTKYLAFIIGALGMFGYDIPKGYEVYIPSSSKFPRVRKRKPAVPSELNEKEQKEETEEKEETEITFDLRGK